MRCKDRLNASKRRLNTNVKQHRYSCRRSAQPQAGDSRSSVTAGAKARKPGHLDSARSAALSCPPAESCSGECSYDCGLVFRARAHTCSVLVLTTCGSSRLAALQLLAHFTFVYPALSCLSRDSTAGLSSESPGCTPDTHDKRSPVPIGRAAGEGQCIVFPPQHEPSSPDC